MLAVRISLVCCVLAACSDSGGGTAVDAKMPDSPAGGATVLTVTCPATPAATITATAAKYNPETTTISQGQIVKFTMPIAHNVAPLPPMTDSGITVGYGKEACLMFTSTGTFKFMCQSDGFVGTITVN